MNRLLDHLRRVLEEPLGDADLLDRFIERREEAAFSALLKRHGPMVFGVCRRILGNVHDAEEAFQATFLVLARKAASVRPRVAVGAWLSGVAYRTALEARTKITRRCSREIQVDEMPEPEERQQSCCNELLSILDREVHRLPDKYRVPVILCDLEGRSRKEVAGQLNIPEGTLSSRLATAHKKLAWRLTRLGLSFSGASLAVLLLKTETSACVPALLRVATTKAALLTTAGKSVGVSAGVITLTEGVLRTMYLAKMKTATLLLCGVATLGFGTGGLVYQTRAGAADSSQHLVLAQGRNLDDDDAERREKDRAKLAEERARLRASVESARREAEAERERAEAERKRAQDAMRELKEQLAKARQEEKQARQQARSADKAQNSNRDEPQGLNRLAEAEAKTREQFKKARQTLMEQLKTLDAEERETLRKLRAERSLVQKPQKSQGGDKASQSGDKLDRILERLDRMERRLDRLEQGRKE